VIDLFYSGSSASITGGSNAILLPVVDPSIDTKSLDNLRASKSQSLHYEQILDRSVPINSYAATVNFEFEIPSIVFDHSSLIYIYNMTNETIVFGFGNADAFAQTLGWPETGIAMIIKGECLSENANDVFMLNGFIYDTNLLTVAANFTQSEIANVSTNVSVTFGPSNNATTNATTNSTISGDPQPYSPDVEYVNPLFFSNKTVNLDNAYYANLNGSNDSATDDEAGCYYNSFSQALLYDIVDGRNYDDKTAYNKLANSVAAKGYGRQNISDIDANPVAQNATSSDQASPTIIESFSAKQNAKFDEVFKLARERLSNNRTGMSTLSRRRRRHQHRRNIGMSIASKNLVRHKRFWGFLEDAVNAVADVFTPVVDTVVDAVKPVIDTVTEVGKVVATAIFGGVYEKNAQININIGYDNPVQIYRIEDLRIMCMECNIKGTVDIHGRFDFGKDGIETVMNEGYVETTGKIVAKAVGGLVGAVTIKKGIEVATIPLTNINIPGVFTLGPQIVLEVGVSVKIGEDLNATFGAYVTWERIYTKIDMKHPDKSQSTGWDPDHVEPKFSFSSEAVVEVGVYVEPRIELTLEAFGGIIEATAGLAATGTLGASAEYDESSEDCPGGVQLGAFVSIELSVFAEFGIIDFKLVNEEYSIFEHSIPISSIYCIGALSQTTPPQITSESTTSTPAIDVKFTTTASPTIGVSTTTTSPTLGVSTTTTSPTDSKSTTTTPPSNGESTTNTSPTDGKSTTTTSLTTIPQAEFTTITTSISISTTTLQACNICCDSENNGLPCGSSCTCNGPHMRDDGAGIVGRFTCWQGDPPVQKRFYSRLCFPTTSIEPTTTAPSIDATTSMSTAIVPTESTTGTTSISIPTTTLEACIICCDSENNDRPCGSSCTCNGPHMRDDGAGIVGRFTCWQGDPPVQKRFYSRLCFPTTSIEPTTTAPSIDATTSMSTAIVPTESTTGTTSISIPTTTLEACIICCDSENNDRPCGSSCTCNGPHMRDDGAGIVGRFTCWQGDPPVQKRFYSRLCFPTTSIEPTTTAPSIDATTSMSTAIVPTESTTGTTSISIPTTTLEACIICCDSENNDRPCGSSCTCNGPHMRDDGAGIVGRFTCWQGDPPVQKRFYSRLCFPTTTAITATSTITDISITTQPNTEIPDISSDNTHEFTHQSTSTTNTNTVTAETSTSIMTSIIVSSATTTLENNPETTAEPMSQSSSTLIIEYTTINDLVETTTSTRINSVISEELTSPSNPEVTTTYTATSETTEQLITPVTSSITTDESTTIPQETEKTTKEATSGEISDESSSSTHTESSTEYTTTLEATETITRSVTNTIITDQSVSSTNIESTTISDSAEIITKEKTSAGISDQSASSTHTKSTVQDATTPVVTNTEISNKPTSATHTESTVQDTTTAEATEIITRAVTNAEASDEPTSPIHIKSSMDYIRTTEGTEIITTTVTNAISTDERISPAYTESTVQDSTTAETTEIITRSVTTVGLSDESASVTHAESTIQDTTTAETTEIITRAVTTVGLSDESTSVAHAESTIQDSTTAETTEIITRSVTTVGLSDESTSVTHAESTIQDTTTVETTEIITQAVTTVGLGDESTVQETTIAETTESITRAVTSAEISDELSTETHTELITTAMMITTTEYNSVITSLSTVDDRTEGHTDSQLVTTVDDITVVTEVPLSTCDMCCDAANTNRTCSSSNCRCDGSDYTGGSGTANAYYHCLEGDPPHSEPYILFGCGPPVTT